MILRSVPGSILQKWASETHRSELSQRKFSFSRRECHGSAEDLLFEIIDPDPSLQGWGPSSSRVEKCISREKIGQPAASYMAGCWWQNKTLWKSTHPWMIGGSDIRSMLLFFWYQWLGETPKKKNMLCSSSESTAHYSGSPKWGCDGINNDYWYYLNTPT